MTLEISFKLLNSEAKMPTKAHQNDAAFDLFSSEAVTLAPSSTTLIPTGLQLADMKSLYAHPGVMEYFLKIEGRSSLAAKHCIFPVGGIIDASYRGEIKIIMFNGSNREVTLQAGDRVAQLIPYHISTAAFLRIAEEVTETTRGANGFGSTGAK
jgi:dUTP pyrophosphatase